MGGSPSIVVAGAGALGLASALALARRGARVTVFDPAAPGDNASGVAAGMLAPVFEAVLDASARPHFDLLCAARDLWPDFAAGAGVALARDGALAVGEEPWLQRVGAALTELGAAVRPVTGEALRIAAPGLDRRFGRGLWTGDDWRLEAGPALAALRKAAAAAGVVFRPAQATGQEPCDLMVTATGAAQGLADAAPELAGLTPIKGHILQLAGALRTVVRGRDIYAAPGRDGLLIGATMEMGIDDRRVDPAKAARLQAAAASLFPGLARAPGEARTGVRAASADGLPLAGWSRTHKVLVAAGARRNGWLLAPLVAQVICACAFGDDPGPYAARLDPRRFSPPG
jgi:glycine oxidase